MEFREITTFLQVAQHQSFSKAARQLGYSQAAVTIQIKQLENELGVHLFDRIGKQISLTHQGQVFYQYAISIQKDLAQARQAVSDSSELNGKRFHLPRASFGIPPAIPGGNHQYRDGLSRCVAGADERKCH